MTDDTPRSSADAAAFDMGQSLGLRTRQGLLYADEAQIAIARGRLERPLPQAEQGEIAT